MHACSASGRQAAARPAHSRVEANTQHTHTHTAQRADMPTGPRHNMHSAACVYVRRTWFAARAVFAASRLALSVESYSNFLRRTAAE